MLVTLMVSMLVIDHNSDYHVVYRSGVHVSWKIEVKLLVFVGVSVFVSYSVLFVR